MNEISSYREPKNLRIEEVKGGFIVNRPYPQKAEIAKDGKALAAIVNGYFKIK
jgi:hypothetical protein